MPLEIPSKGDVRERGEIAYDAVEKAYAEDTMWPRAIGKAVRSYLEGYRNFRVPDPNSPSHTLIQVKLEDGYPAHEAILSDVTREIGKQHRIDIEPKTFVEVETIKSSRDAAVAQGLLSYHFSKRVLDRPNLTFCRQLVIDGYAGLTIAPTVYPGFGRGLKLINIPARHLCFLPAGARSNTVRAIVWRRYVPYNHVKSELMKAKVSDNRKVRTLPERGAEGYSSLIVQDVPYGSDLEPKQGAEDPAISLFRSQLSGKSHQDSPKKRFGRFVLLIQIFFTRDFIHLDRRMTLAGKYLLEDVEYPEFERPMMPITTASYADIGNPQGRSYAHARMAVNIRNEEVLTMLMRNARKIDAYGMIAMSTNMGMNLADVLKEGDGFKVLNYTPDASSPQAQPLQITPINLGQAVGRVFGLMGAMGGEVYPESPMNVGQSAGRIDGDPAYKRLERMGQTAIRVGAESARLARIQMYRTGLELAGQFHKPGDVVPLFSVIPELAGVVLDVEEIPLSEAQQQKQSLIGRMLASRDMGSKSPLITQELRGNLNASPLEAEGRNTPQLVPVARFRIGPNIIPTPNEVTIDISSMLPRDEDSEFDEIMVAVKTGASSIMEAQIEMRLKGIKRYFGGRAVWATYQSTVLNLLSAFGNGIETGPIIIQPNIFAREVGFWVVSTFVAGPLFGLASSIVRNRVLELLYMYAPPNQTGSQLSADEAAAMFSMRENARMQSQQGMQNQIPQLPEGF
jgi:hypothetical protein